MTTTRRPSVLPLALLVPLAACVTFTPDVGPSRPWLGALHRDDAQVGTIREGATGQPIDVARLVERLVGADLVLLGELHDNPDHHVLQSELLRALVARGRRPAVVFEMLDAAQQPAIDAVLATKPTPEAFAVAVDWAHSGWPPFAEYRPIVAVALESGLPIVGGDLTTDEARSIVRGGPDALPLDLRALSTSPLEEGLATEWAEEMRASHCGHLPESMLPAMVLAQRARDLRLASRIVLASEGRGVVLVAGSGHARSDRAVPWWLGRIAASKRVVSVALREVDPSERGSSPWPFDVVLFTPGVEREDPCARFRRPAQ